MAERTVNDLNNPERRDLTVQATYQVEQMLEVLLKAARNDQYPEPLPYLLRGMVPRLLELNSVVMSAAADEMEDMESLRLRLDGGWYQTLNTTA